MATHNEPSKISPRLRMSQSDWNSLQKHILSGTDISLGSRFRRLEIRLAFHAFEEHNYDLKGIRISIFITIGNSLKKSLVVMFKTVPKRLNKKDIEGLTAQWRLQIGK